MEGIPPETFELASAAALDPNRSLDPEYIVRLLGQVITVSLETANVVKGLPTLGKINAL
jgi:predicted helicase